MQHLQQQQRQHDNNDQATWQRKRSARVLAASPTPPADPNSEITVCDITGDWGLYQWSLCLFATIYSGLAGMVVVFGPMLTPDMAHGCQVQQPAGQEGANQTLLSPPAHSQISPADIGPDQHECFLSADPGSPPLKCANFVYSNHSDQLGHLMLTNGFDLVCDRQWLRSLVSSSALAGMLVSSVTLGLFSDKFGRLRCIQLSFIISCLANVVALAAHNYFLFCACIALMSYAQVGAANALCTLLMEATSPRFRYVPVAEYGFGWGLGTMTIPLVNYFTHDYRFFMGFLLISQLLLLPWLHFGIFESIRWLLSEGHFNRAQIELRRACRMNNVEAGTKLAQSIARIEAQQVRKASRVIEHQTAPLKLSKVLGSRVDDTARELDILNAAIKRSFFGETGDHDHDHQSATIDNGAGDVARRPSNSRRSIAPALNNVLSAGQVTNETPAPIVETLSPTLARMSFSLPTTPTDGPLTESANANGTKQKKTQLECLMEEDRRGSFTTQGLIQLTMKYSKAVQKNDEGRCFLVQMLNKKLWRQTVILLSVSVMYETCYYGLVQANKFVGNSINLNYVIGAFSECGAALASCFMLAFFSRKFSLISCTLLGALACFCMALSYQLIPDQIPSSGLLDLSSEQTNSSSTEIINLVVTTTTTPAPGQPAIPPPPPPPSPVIMDLIANDANLQPINLLEGANLTVVAASGGTHRPLQSAGPSEAIQEHQELVQLRQTINFYVMSAGKFVIITGIQVAATIAMEAYPNNLRQTGSGVIVFAGRVGSIMAPFLFNDPSEDKHVFKLTLVVLAVIGLLVCCFVPLTIKDQKDKELCDQMNEIE